jgi:hypothetical protein
MHQDSFPHFEDSIIFEVLYLFLRYLPPYPPPPPDLSIGDQCHRPAARVRGNHP